ncbi:MAG: sensor histidine kinase [Flammeovirgaceae bacterium]
MKRRTLRIFIVLAVFSLMGIVIVQYYWFTRAFSINKTRIDLRISNALQEVAEKLVPLEKRTSSFFQPVTHVSNDYFEVMVNDTINPAVLGEYLKLDFIKHNIELNAEFGVYNCDNGLMEYGDFICPTGDCKPPTEQTRYVFPHPEHPDSFYFGVYFPDKNSFLLSDMGIWLFSTIVVLIVILFFAYSLFVIVRQKRLSEIQTDFINNMTHEFKTPISTIDISSSVLMNPKIIEKPERLLSYATIIKNEAVRLKNQVEKVLQVAVLNKKSEELKITDLHLHNLLEELELNWTATLEKKNAILETHFDAQVDFIAGDRLHLTNVFNNLIDNSIKYCESDQPYIKLNTFNEKGYIVLTLQDNGIGIAEKDVKMIFNKFYRVHTGNVHNVKGFGLGLHYVKMMIDAHKGTITAQSKVGEGTLFTIKLKNLKTTT